MWSYEKRLQFPVNIKEPNAKLAQVIISQFGGPDGELAASMRYLSQRYSMPYREVAGLLTDIGTEELAHLEMVGAIVHQLTRNLSMEEIEKSGFDKYYVDHTVGVWPQAAGGVPFNANQFQVKGDIITDLHEDMAADAAPLQTHPTMEGGVNVQKLKNRVVDKMLQSHLTKAEVDFMLEISHYQDDTGKIYGVYYKSICDAIGISYQTFYVTIDSLVAKGLINCERSRYGDWNIVICDNDFSYRDATKEGYVSTAHKLFTQRSFHRLKAKEKLLALQLVKICGTSGHYYININEFYKKYAEMLEVSIRSIQIYLGKLKEFFSVVLCKKNYWMKAKQDVINNTDSYRETDVEKFSKHLGKVACRRNKVSYTMKNFKDTIDLIRQHSQDFKSAEMAERFLQAVETSIIRPNSHQRDKRKWNRNLNSKYVHKLLLEK